MICYNSTVRFGEPLPVSAEALPSIKISNIDYVLFCEAFPAYTSVVENLLSLLPKKRYAAVTVMAEYLTEGRGTCVDTCWHLDGRLSDGNQDHYALVCFGDEDVRTMFYARQFDGEAIVSPVGIEGRNSAFEAVLGHELHDERHGFVVPNSVPVVYTSLDFHKGRVATRRTRRVLVRAMTSDVIKPQKPKGFLHKF